MIETNRDAKQWGMLCHLSALVQFLGIPGLLGPLVLWLVKKDGSKFVDDQGKEALNFHLNVFIYELLCIPLAFVVVGFFLLPIIFVASIVFTILAGVEASKGKYYRYPCVLFRLVS